MTPATQREPPLALVGVRPLGRTSSRDLRTLGCEVPVLARSEASIARAREGRADAIVPSFAAAFGEVDGIVVFDPDLRLTRRSTRGSASRSASRCSSRSP